MTDLRYGIARRLWVIRGVVMAIATVAFALCFTRGSMAWLAAVAVTAAAYFFGLILERRIVGAALAREARASAAQDMARMRAINAELRPYLSPKSPVIARLELHLAFAFEAEEKHREACEVYERLRTSTMGQRLTVMVDNNLAWSLIQAGDVPRAIELAHQTLGRALATKHPLVGFCRGTLAVAMVMGKREEEGAALLEQVIAEHPGDGSRAQATRWFFLGEALSAMAKPEAARAAYQRSANEDATSPWARKALDRLGAENQPPLSS